MKIKTKAFGEVEVSEKQKLFLNMVYLDLMIYKNLSYLIVVIIPHFIGYNQKSLVK